MSYPLSCWAYGSGVSVPWVPVAPTTAHCPESYPPLDMSPKSGSVSKLPVDVVANEPVE